MIPDSLNLLGHVGYVFLIAGTLLLAHKKSLGWLSRIFGEIVWLFIGVSLQMSSIWFWGIVFLFMEIYGFYQWKKALVPLDRKLVPM